jgi:cold shock CspA family protein
MTTERQTGKIISYDVSRGFGFLAVPNQFGHVFVHAIDLERAGLNAPIIGDWLSFDAVDNPRKPGKPMAKNLSVA